MKPIEKLSGIGVFVPVIDNFSTHQIGFGTAPMAHLLAEMIGSDENSTEMAYRLMSSVLAIFGDHSEAVGNGRRVLEALERGLDSDSGMLEFKRNSDGSMTDLGVDVAIGARMARMVIVLGGQVKDILFLVNNVYVCDRNHGDKLARVGQVFLGVMGVCGREDLVPEGLGIDNNLLKIG